MTLSEHCGNGKKSSLKDQAGQKTANCRVVRSFCIIQKLSKENPQILNHSPHERSRPSTRAVPIPISTCPRTYAVKNHWLLPCPDPLFVLIP